MPGLVALRKERQEKKAAYEKSNEAYQLKLQQIQSEVRQNLAELNARLPVEISKEQVLLNSIEELNSQELINVFYTGRLIEENLDPDFIKQVGHSCLTIIHAIYNKLSQGSDQDLHKNASIMYSILRGCIASLNLENSTKVYSVYKDYIKNNNVIYQAFIDNIRKDLDMSSSSADEWDILNFDIGENPYFDSASLTEDKLDSLFKTIQFLNNVAMEQSHTEFSGEEEINFEINKSEQCVKLISNAIFASEYYQEDNATYKLYVHAIDRLLAKSQDSIEFVSEWKYENGDTLLSRAKKLDIQEQKIVATLERHFKPVSLKRSRSSSLSPERPAKKPRTTNESTSLTNNSRHHFLNDPSLSQPTNVKEKKDAPSSVSQEHLNLRSSGV